MIGGEKKTLVMCMKKKFLSGGMLTAMVHLKGANSREA